MPRGCVPAHAAGGRGGRRLDLVMLLEKITKRQRDARRCTHDGEVFFPAWRARHDGAIGLVGARVAVEDDYIFAVVLSANVIDVEKWYW